MGLSGMGDLVLTATGDLSRNRKVGLLLAEGKTLQDAVQSLGHVAEGVYSARTVLQRALHLGVDMPITNAVDGVLRRASVGDLVDQRLQQPTVGAGKLAVVLIGDAKDAEAPVPGDQGQEEPARRGKRAGSAWPRPTALESRGSPRESPRSGP